MRFFFAKNRTIDEAINGKKDSSGKGDKDTKPNRYAWEEVFDLIAKEYYGGDWNKAMKLNIYAFSHRLKFITHKAKKELQQVKAARKR